MLDVYPLAIPEGEGLSIPVKLVGDLGFRNYRGLLVLIVPAAVAEVVRQELAEEIGAKEAVGRASSRRWAGAGSSRSSPCGCGRGCGRRCRWGSGGR